MLQCVQACTFQSAHAQRLDNHGLVLTRLSFANTIWRMRSCIPNHHCCDARTLSIDACPLWMHRQLYGGAGCVELCSVMHCRSLFCADDECNPISSPQWVWYVTIITIVSVAHALRTAIVPHRWPDRVKQAAPMQLTITVIG